MTMPDMMRSGHCMTCEDIECDEGGIIGDMNYETATDEDKVMLLTSKKIMCKMVFYVDALLKVLQ